MASQDQTAFTFLAEHTADLIFRAGLDMVLQYASPSSQQSLGWSTEEFLGKSLHTFTTPEDAAAFAAADPASHAPALEKEPVNIRLQKKDGTYQWVEARRRLLLDPITGEPNEYLLLMRDLHETGTIGDEHSPSTFTKPLHGLAGYHDLLRDLEREWSRAHRDSQPLSLLRLDFNGFRQFHFLDGHRVGDECLAKAAAAVTKTLRLTDYAAQCSTEDLVVILPSTDAEGAGRLANRLKNAINLLRSPRSLEGQAWAAVSIGIATVTPRTAGSARMPDLLLLAAEHALQNAQKQEGESLRHIAAYAAHNTDWKKSMPGITPHCA